MKVSFGIIGNNWGNKIYKILKLTNNDVFKVPIKSPNKYKNYESYVAALKKILKKFKKKCNIIWLAISPNEKIQFDVVKLCIENNFNLIIEKPWLVNKKNTAHLKQLQKKHKILVGFNFEYLYLDFFKQVHKHLFHDKSTVSLDFHVKNIKLKNIHFNELGSHLLAIKKYFFKDIKKLKITTGFKKNLRRVVINKNKINEKILDFTNNNEPLIQRFVTDFLKHLKKKKKYPLDFNLALIK
jgi:hypothetical protein